MNGPSGWVSLAPSTAWTSDLDLSGLKAVITKYISDFDFAYDHLNAALSAAIYSVQGKIDALTASLATVNTNKTHQDDMNSIYLGYTQWQKVFDNTTALPDVTYYGGTGNQFSCSGDVLNTTMPYLSAGADLLIDCGLDGKRGCIISDSSYIPVSAGNYTLVTIVADVRSYPPDLVSGEVNITFDNPPSAALLSVTPSGGSPITGLVYNDTVSFTCLGNVTGTLVQGTKLIAHYNDILTEYRYFSVHASEYNPVSGGPYNPTDADKTIFTISNGLTITPNITSVSVVGPV
jgi:hypothetical protein